ncbi:hypothetical protein [Microcoleus sp. Pol12B5]|uniref:hypothetical protein n=1 Tax=Microcoleus sp. Pol12B5 TaxID=3055396 RepID=UPI002FD36456
MEQISINLTIEEVNKILDSLGNRPYIEVFQLINKIQAQAEAQLQAKKIREQQLSQEAEQS